MLGGGCRGEISQGAQRLHFHRRQPTFEPVVDKARYVVCAIHVILEDTEAPGGVGLPGASSIAVEQLLEDMTVASTG